MNELNGALSLRVLESLKAIASIAGTAAAAAPAAAAAVYPARYITQRELHEGGATDCDQQRNVIPASGGLAAADLVAPKSSGERVCQKQTQRTR